VHPRGHARDRADASVLPPGNFITDATVRPSHGRPSGHRPTVCPSAIARVTTLAAALSVNSLLALEFFDLFYFIFLEFWGWAWHFGRMHSTPIF
jgi:hypothetical protein